MTREKLQEQITQLREGYPAKARSWGNADADRWWRTQVDLLINQYVAEVIGEDEVPKPGHRANWHEFIATRNWLRSEQRKRAG